MPLFAQRSHTSDQFGGVEKTNPMEETRCLTPTIEIAQRSQKADPTASLKNEPTAGAIEKTPDGLFAPRSQIRQIRRVEKTNPIEET
jgi:hypothetical protein